MLVLSRGPSDTIVFPTLDISVEILRISGNRVRIGIEAPKEVAVLRGEIEPRPEDMQRRASAQPDRHQLRNRLQKATLGLQLVQRMVELGKCDDVEPTIFKVFNELKAIESELNPPASNSDSATTYAEKHCRALVVEDDANENELLSGYLQLSGFAVTSAYDGLQAIAHLAKDERPDIVLLDMKMPRFDGGRTVRAIRQNTDYRSLRIFAVSGTEQSETDVTLGPNGVDRWFTKPVNPQLLVDAIREEIDSDCALA